MLKRTLFFGNKCSLTTKYEQLVIKNPKKETTVPIEDIGFVVIENQETYISLLVHFRSAGSVFAKFQM